MQFLIDALAIAIGYILGSIPFGVIWVRLISGKDIRRVASGRTGGTNAARAAGAGAGVLTALMDISKSAASVWIAEALTPDNHWIHVLAPIAAILGHNYSMFLIERDSDNRLRLRGGAGGGPAAGGAIGLWWPAALVLLPTSMLVFFGIGYASLTTLSVAMVSTAIFTVRYYMGLGPMADIFYGVIAFFLLAWALRPNIAALMDGRERFHGWRPWRSSKPLFPAHDERPAEARGEADDPARGGQRPKDKHSKTAAAKN